MKPARAGGREGAQAQARAALGSLGLGSLAYLMATRQIEVSGSGPSDPSARAQLMESGWRPNSIKVGDAWMEMTLFQPISVPLTVMANAFDTWREQGTKNEDTASKVLATALRSLRSMLDQSFLNGVADFVELVETRSTKAAAKYLGRQAHSLTPFAGAQRTIVAATDPTVRAPEGFAENVKAGVPGLSSDLEPRLDRFGQEVTRPGGPARRAADPFNTSPVSKDPVVNELGRLGVSMGLQTARMALPGDMQLTRDEEFAIRKTKGVAVHRVLDRLMSTDAYAGLPDDQRRELLERAITRTRAAVTEQAKAAALKRRASAGARR